MSAQYCKVGKIKPSLNKTSSLNKRHTFVKSFMNNQTKLDQTKNLGLHSM